MPEWSGAPAGPFLAGVERNVPKAGQVGSSS